MLPGARAPQQARVQMLGCGALPAPNASCAPSMEIMAGASRRPNARRRTDWFIAAKFLSELVMRSPGAAASRAVRKLFHGLPGRRDFSAGIRVAGEPR